MEKRRGASRNSASGSAVKVASHPGSSSLLLVPGALPGINGGQRYRGSCGFLPKVLQKLRAPLKELQKTQAGEGHWFCSDVECSGEAGGEDREQAWEVLADPTIEQGLVYHCF
ncbi:uncharacterized protein LOC119470132 [Cebus imitator]|uniref:uncharacterized protein LOC119470132 n=1 Tax=Cebus imitator TaxID=2715852 RepID=UPI00189BF785|nr:uncharacterized protein LOC119470132 [Cebus imitator]